MRGNTGARAGAGLAGGGSVVGGEDRWDDVRGLPAWVRHVLVMCRFGWEVDGYADAQRPVWSWRRGNVCQGESQAACKREATIVDVDGWLWAGLTGERGCSGRCQAWRSSSPVPASSLSQILVGRSIAHGHGPVTRSGYGRPDALLAAHGRVLGSIGIHPEADGSLKRAVCSVQYPAPSI